LYVQELEISANSYTARVLISLVGSKLGLANVCNFAKAKIYTV